MQPRPFDFKNPTSFPLWHYHLWGVHHSIRFETFDHGGHGIRENHEKHLPLSPSHWKSEGQAKA